MGGSPPLRREKTGRKGAALDSSVQFLEGQGDVHSQLRAILVENQVRIIDLFRQFDADASGLVDADEFAAAMGRFGLAAPARSYASVIFSQAVRALRQDRTLGRQGHGPGK